MLIFPCDYFDHRFPDGIYENEHNLTPEDERLLIDYDVLLEGRDPFKGTYDTIAIWRGWQMTSSLYDTYCSYCRKHGLIPITDTDTYISCQSLRASYPRCKNLMLPTVLIDGVDIELAAIKATFTALHTDRLFIKDYVKSGYTPCVIDIAMEDDEILDTAAKLIKERGTAYAGGLAIRPFVKMSGETRFIVLDDEIVVWGPHSDGDGSVPLEVALDAMRRCDIGGSSRFYVFDMAYADGKPVIIETGDGQSSEGVSGMEDKLISAIRRVR